jgi:hypothetical protein
MLQNELGRERRFYVVAMLLLVLLLELMAGLAMAVASLQAR